MKEGLQEKIGKYITIVLVAAIAVGGLFFAYPAYQRGKLLKAQEAELNEKIADKQHEIAKLKEYQRRFKVDPEFVEQIARQNRRVYPGELIFIFEDRAK